MAEGEVLFIGDSLTEWFDWAGRFPAHRVQNMGISGETVEGLLDRVGRAIDACANAEMVFVMTGINNVAMDDVSFLPSYRRIVRSLRQGLPGARIYVQSVLPALLPWTDPGVIGRINVQLSEMAGDEGAEYLDIHSHFTRAGVRECLSPDGVHLSPWGYEVWALALSGTLKSG